MQMGNFCLFYVADDDDDGEGVEMVEAHKKKQFQLEPFLVNANFMTRASAWGESFHFYFVL